MMDFQEIHSWTLVDLMRAFVQLAVAYFLLCGSVFAFFALKLLSFFGVYFPCPCEGFLGFKNSDFCFHQLLSDWPARQISCIQKLALERFPFDLLLLKDHSCSSTNEILHSQRTLQLEDEASCSSYSASTRSRFLVDREISNDAKGKRVANSKRKSGIRRRRKAVYERGTISSPVSFSCPPPSEDTHVTSLHKDHNKHLSKVTESLYCPIGGVDLQNDDEVAATGNDVDEKSCHSYEFNCSFVDNKELEIYTSSIEICANNAQDKTEMAGNEVDRIKMLEQALEEEKAARIALYLELEKERAAAATAADEAMAMMFRLQEEKASIEMEMRQYQRVIEERFVYDEEEMDILKEILVRREKENHMLEREIETYRRMSCGGNGLSEGETNGMEGDTSSFFDERDDLLLDLQAEYGRYAASKTTDGSHSNNESPDFRAAQTCVTSFDRQEGEKDCKQIALIEDGFHVPTSDGERVVFDVHVVDDNIDLQKEESCEPSGFSSNSAADGPGDFTIYVTSTDTNAQLPTSMEPKDNTSAHDSSEYSSCAENNEKFKIDDEIEMLWKRLQMLLHGKEKMTGLQDEGETQHDQFKRLRGDCLSDQEMKQFGHAARCALSTSSSKVTLKERRSQSVSLDQ